MSAYHPFVTLAICLLLIACGGAKDQSSDTETAEPTEEVIAAEHQRIIAGLEDSIYDGEMQLKRRYANEIFDVYLAYAAEHPLDTITPEYLFRAAQVASGLKKNEMAIALYDRIIKNYSAWSKIPEAKFMKGFTYETRMDQQGAAMEAYKDLIYDHPDHPLTAQAKQLIDNMQYTDEELIKKWKEENEKAES